MENLRPDTLFIGQETCFLAETDSTNVWMQEQLKKGPLSEGYLVHSDFQRNGKGRLQRSWHSDAGKNLMFSLFLRPAFLNVTHQSALSFLTALAVADTVSEFISDEVRVKWPNDVMCQQKKIAGILIENQLRGAQIDRSVIGIGLNVNQEMFPDNIPGISMKMCSGIPLPRKSVLETFCRKFETRYLQLRNSGQASLLHEYNQRLYGRNSKVKIQRESEMSEGILLNIDADGCAHIVTNGTLNRYHFNSVKIIYDGSHS